ncbi:MAG: hypothetical protein Q8797_00935 [Candidatus Phytoplasma australasiaticum]|nr:hypothetical protein [Candidatus Phytoplasma australasiaticum]
MMKQSNFFQKKGVFIFLLTILGLVCCYFYFENQKETSLVSESESTTEPLFSEETPTLPRPKRSVKEPPIPQINTTAARLEQIKNYLFNVIIIDVVLKILNRSLVLQLEKLSTNIS